MGQDFHRLANDRSLATWVELGTRAAGNHSAAVAILNKVVSKGLDAVEVLVTRHAAHAAPGGAPQRPATPDEEAPYFDDYAALAEGLVATARARRQDVAFF